MTFFEYIVIVGHCYSPSFEGFLLFWGFWGLGLDFASFALPELSSDFTFSIPLSS